MTFLECINRILRINAIIRGDTDTVSTFSDVQHNASMNLAIIASQTELVDIIADRLIPSERITSGSITLATNTRTYSLATDFIRFYGEPAFYRVATNDRLTEYPGGLETLQTQIYDYATQYGSPTWFYFEPTTTKKIGLFMVPDSSFDTLVYTYEYEGSVMISASTDDLPFHNDEENYAFVDMAARRFKYMYEDVKNEADIQAVLEKDRTWLNAKRRLYHLVKGKNPSTYYGTVYQ